MQVSTAFLRCLLTSERTQVRSLPRPLPRPSLRRRRPEASVSEHEGSGILFQRPWCGRHDLSDRLRAGAAHPHRSSAGAGSMTAACSRHTDPGAVRVGVKANALRVGLRPSLDPVLRATPRRTYREQPEGSRSANFRSLRFEGIAATAVDKAVSFLSVSHGYWLPRSRRGQQRIDARHQPRAGAQRCGDGLDGESLRCRRRPRWCSPLERQRLRPRRRCGTWRTRP
jgi:hypothetical protein